MEACTKCNQKFITSTMMFFKLYDGKEVCIECFFSPDIKYCKLCGEYYPSIYYTTLHNCCTGCYDTRGDKPNGDT